MDLLHGIIQFMSSSLPSPFELDMAALHSELLRGFPKINTMEDKRFATINPNVRNIKFGQFSSPRREFTIMSTILFSASFQFVSMVIRYLGLYDILPAIVEERERRRNCFLKHGDRSRNAKIDPEVWEKATWEESITVVNGAPCITITVVT